MDWWSAPPAAKGCPACPTWTSHLPWVLLGLHAAPREEDNISPAQAVFSTPIVLRGQFLDGNGNVHKLQFFIKFSNKLGAAETIATRPPMPPPSPRFSLSGAGCERGGSGG
jgi:hypothetical protein